MKLFKSIVLSLAGILVLTTSCNNKKTYSDYLKDERKAIDLLIAKNNYVILKKFPSDGKFSDKEFYKDPSSGVYFNIIDMGDTTVRLQWKEKVHVRFNGLQYFNAKDTTKVSNEFNVNPETFEFVGAVSSSNKNSYSTPGWVVPLSYVGHKSRVKMIIPFDMGDPGSQSQFQPTFYEEVKYSFDSQW